MATCLECDQEMTDRVPCTSPSHGWAGGTRERPRAAYGSAAERRITRWPLRQTPPHCGDCGTPIGGLHHPGCDGEHCVRCRGQAIACRCSVGMEDLLELIGIADDW